MTNKRYIFFYGVLLAIVSVSFIFTNVSYDAEYQMAMAYRMIKGDAMLLEMWEPHQTSAFLCALFMKLYMMITGTTTGVVLFLQLAGLIIRGGLSVLIYRAFLSVTDRIPALAAAVLYMLISPKDLLIPEFGNMQLWFATGMFLAMWEYFSVQKVIYLVTAAVSFCLGIFSYPSFIIAYIAALFLLYQYSAYKKRDIFIFTSICTAIGIGFAGYFLYALGFDTILTCLSSALSLEPSHTISFWDKIVGFAANITAVAAAFIIIAALGYVTEKITGFANGNKNGGKSHFVTNRWLLLSGYVLSLFVFLNIVSARNRSWYSVILIAILGLGFIKRKLLAESERQLYNCAFWIGSMNLICTLLLSDHPLLPAVPYMLITICASVLPIYRWFQKSLAGEKGMHKMFVSGVHIVLLLLIFRGVFLHVSMYGRSQTCSLLSDLALIRSGPAIGIITDEEGAARQRDSMAEWKAYIKAGDTIWLAGNPLDTMGYLYEDVEVGAPTVMSTPTYNEQLLKYWEMNPEKYPDVVILSSSFGELSWELLNNEWLLSWLEEEYCAESVIDGNYWRYYFKENRE